MLIIIVTKQEVKCKKNSDLKKKSNNCFFLIVTDCRDKSNYSMTDSRVHTEFEFGETIPVFND